MSRKTEIKHEETKEDFCGACAAGLTALIGGGISGSSTAVKNKKTKKKIFIIGLVIAIISILVLLYLLLFKKCENCK